MKKIFAALFPLFFIACASGPGNRQTAFELNDKLFAFENITDTRFIDHLYYDESGLYADSTKKIRFTELDSVQKGRLLAPVLDIDSEYVKQYMSAYFISVQEKINDFTPVIILLNGDDYGALHYILLDRNNKPVSQMIVQGGECAGPMDETDSTVTFCPVRHSVFKQNEILSYVLHTCESTDSIPKPSIIDSVSYHITIAQDGHIKSTRLDSARYERAGRPL